MSILTDRQIRALCDHKLDKPMIVPFIPAQVRETSHPLREGIRKVVSFGTTSMGYDVRLSDTEVKVFSNANCREIDPKNFNDEALIDSKIYTTETGEKYILLPPNSYILGVTPEYFSIPKNILTVCVGKSTYARSGLSVNVTPVEPGFEGNVVIECGNNTSIPIRVYLNEGISQFLFFKATEDCEVGYGDRKGKYQGQTGVTRSKV